MTNLQKQIDDLANEANESELVSQLTPDRETRLRKETIANELRKQIRVLAILKHDHGER